MIILIWREENKKTDDRVIIDALQELTNDNDPAV